MKTLDDVLKSLDYNDRKVSRETKTMGIWKSPAAIIPKQCRVVEVIDYNGKQSIAHFGADDNWCVLGFPHDLFNNDIALWRYPAQQ